MLLFMNLILIYEGLADVNRLRIVHLLSRGPLAVKHLQGILGISQVRVSKHLAYLRKRGMVEVDRNRNWMIYRLPAKPSAELTAQVKCLAECATGISILDADLAARRAIQAEVDQIAASGERSEPTLGAASPASPQPAANVGWGLQEEEGYVD